MSLVAADLAAAITAAQGVASNTAIQNAANLAIATGICTYLNSKSVTSTIPATSIVTTGSAATQSGPQAPLSITGNF